MKVIVKDEKCISCGSCVSLTDGKIFDFDDETGKAFAINNEIKKDDEDITKQAMDFCPTNAIIEEKQKY